MSTTIVSGKRIPAPALLLGGAGLVPFVVPTAVLLLGPAGWREPAWTALNSYAAVILSFLGAVHWGLALRDGQSATREATAGLWRTLSWSVTPALLAWLSLLLPHPFGAGLLLAGFGAQYWMDSRAEKAGRVPAWYLHLRQALTAGVFICLSLALAGTL